ncbi:MAG: hydroxylamine reductase [Oscillospiraceae bacterium]|nr:hydroxylamine reductase [Oscillospiraceae bacterium]
MDRDVARMFCFQCQQTAKGSGCTMSGVCGKKPETALGQDELTCEMIALAKAMEAGAGHGDDYVDMLVDGLFTCITNVNFDAGSVADLTVRIKERRARLGGRPTMGPEELFSGDKDACSLRSTLLFGLRGMAAYAHHARVLGMRDAEVDAWFVKGMASLGDGHTADGWLRLLTEFGGANLRCMALLDAANTGAYGDPKPKAVPLVVEGGPLIVVTGHDLRDFKMLLEQTDGKGVGVYTHGEMLPAHGYPKLARHAQLKGHYSTAWHNQQVEFKDIPAPILWTTNCIMPPKEGYADRAYTTSVVRYPGLRHIEADEGGHKDFTELIDHARLLGGYPEAKRLTGANGGGSMTTGFGRRAVLDAAPAIAEAVRSGAVRHIFLIGGCDGAQPSRGYYADFVRRAPKDTIILTLACGKFRFNDLDLGSIGALPRLVDMGQCNDAYGAVRVAMALAEVFGCGVNDLPLTMVLSWYEQKAVCILLTLLSLGIKGIYIGPTLPAFISPNVLEKLVELHGLTPITTPEADLARIL